jgi:hypothetical protein
VANPCDTQPCSADPPAAFLSGASGEVRLDQGSSCWRSPAPNAQGQFIGRCLDTINREPDALLVVQAGETLTLRFAALTPTDVSLQHDNQTTPLAASNPVRFQVGPAVGIQSSGVQVVGFFTRWLQGDASYGVRLDVRPATAQPGTAPPARPGTGPLSLTG